jgi:hypothetical protein
MKAILASIFVATLLWGCGGGGGNPGTCSGSPQYCAENAEDLTPVPPAFTTTGTGAGSFTLPSAVTRLRIEATHNGTAQSLTVRIGGALVVNELLGTAINPERFVGTYLVTGGATVEIIGSAGVNWFATEVPPQAPTNAQAGSGDTVFDLPTTVQRVRIQASYPGTTQNFIVRVAGQPVVNTLVGTAETPPSHDSIVDIGSGGTVEILGATGVTWSVQEQP